MEVDNALRLIEQYKDCLECGNNLLGNGEGGLEIGEQTFDRWCKCGWKVHVEVKEERKND